MRRAVITASLVAGTLSACAQSRPRGPGSVCDGVDIEAGCGSGTPIGGIGGGGGGGNTSDGGSAVDAAATDAAPGTVSGRVIVAQALPVPTDATGTRAGVGWRVQALDAVGTPTVSATSDDVGDYSLAGVSPAGSRYLVEAVPPAGSGTLATVTELSALPSHLNVNAVLETTMVDAASGVGVSFGRDLGHIVLQFVDVASVSSGVSAQITNGVVATIGYDDVSGGVSAAATSTGNHATIVLFNIAAAANGTPVDIRLTHGTSVATYELTALPGTVNWVQLNAP